MISKVLGNTQRTKVKDQRECETKQHIIEKETVVIMA